MKNCHLTKNKGRKNKIMRISQYLHIDERLKSFRINANMTQRNMAMKLGLSYSTYSNYENGYSEPPIEIIQKFCFIIGINEETFFGFPIVHSDKKLKKNLETNKEIQCFSVIYIDGSIDVFRKI